MSGFTDPLIGGGGAIHYPSIHSPNYVPGSSGWTIDKDGSAQFNNLTIKGTFEGGNFILNSQGLFIYSPTEGAGNLTASVTSASGTDGYGNVFNYGFCVYGGTAITQLSTAGGEPALEMFTGVSSEARPAYVATSAINSGAANESMVTIISGPASTVDGEGAEIWLYSAAKDGSSLSHGQLIGNSVIQAHWDSTGFHTP